MVKIFFIGILDTLLGKQASVGQGRGPNSI